MFELYKALPCGFSVGERCLSCLMPCPLSHLQGRGIFYSKARFVFLSRLCPPPWRWVAPSPRNVREIPKGNPEVPRGFKRIQEDSRGIRGEPRGTERSREVRGEPRGSKRNPRGVERNREEPRGTERNREEPRGAKRNPKVVLEIRTGKVTKVPRWVRTVL